jgi:hypothetical protein
MTSPKKPGVAIWATVGLVVALYVASAGPSYISSLLISVLRPKDESHATYYFDCLFEFNNDDVEQSSRRY